MKLRVDPISLTVALIFGLLFASSVITNRFGTWKERITCEEYHLLLQEDEHIGTVDVGEHFYCGHPLRKRLKKVN